jgi:hypothetical protein
LQCYTGSFIVGAGNRSVPLLLQLYVSHQSLDRYSKSNYMFPSSKPIASFLAHFQERGSKGTEEITGPLAAWQVACGEDAKES